MHVVVSSTFHRSLHEPFRHLIRHGFAGVAADDVEVHVKARGRRRQRPREWSARTYDGIPSIARVVPGMRYLVTMLIPADPRTLRRYPVTHRYPGLKTAPAVTLQSWEEQLLFLAAHEARHVHQFRHGLRRSEVDAERWALARLDGSG